jgi:hypothetical protein
MSTNNDNNQDMSYNQFMREFNDYQNRLTMDQEEKKIRYRKVVLSCLSEGQADLDYSSKMIAKQIIDRLMRG